MDQFATVGDTVSFACEATGGVHPIMYTWLLNGAVLMADPGHISGVNTTNLTITNVIATDGGNYSCHATNGSTNATSNEATLFSESTFSTLKIIMPCHD